MSKSLIYSCVFKDKNYLKLINLLLKSYKIYGNFTEDIDYLIICDKEFETKIQKFYKNLNINGKIWGMNIQTKFDACCSRLKIFDYIDINLYTKILYLDTDVLITNSINKILNLELEDKIYALLEGNTNCGNGYYGFKLFTENPNCSAFSSGVMLFNNKKIIKQLFIQIQNDINKELKKYKYQPLFGQTKEVNFKDLFGDQPFIVYNAIKDGLYNNQKLINLVINNPEEYKGEIICHFPGKPGFAINKFQKMKHFFDNCLFQIRSVEKLEDYIHLLNNKTYNWNELSIKFLETGKIEIHSSTNVGKFNFINNHLIRCEFEFDKKKYLFKFDEDYSTFISIRKVDLLELTGYSGLPILLNVYQSGRDGFGHQLEGTLRLMSLHLNNKIYYNFNYEKKYSFQHNNVCKELLINYLKQSNRLLKNTYETNTEVVIDSKITGLDGIGSGKFLPDYFEKTNGDLSKNLKELRDIFVEKNTYLPEPIYNKKNYNICIHVRLGDAVTTKRKLDKRIGKSIDIFRLKYPDAFIHIFSDEPDKIKYTPDDKKILYDKKTDVLKIMSSFIHCDILVMSYSSLSIVAHLLGKKSQIVYKPYEAGVTFPDRILKKCINIKTLFN